MKLNDAETDQKNPGNDLYLFQSGILGKIHSKILTFNFIHHKFGGNE
jgi:hypothetical protein